MSSEEVLYIKLGAPEAIMPTKSPVGYDIYSPVNAFVSKKDSMLIPTGLAIGVPSGYCGKLVSRFELAFKHGIEIGLNVIDSEYRKHLVLLLYNFSNKDFEFKKGDKIAQLIIEKISDLKIVQVDTIPPLKKEEANKSSS